MPEPTVRVRVDAGKDLGELPRIWNYIGYDECNYTYVPEGRALLALLGKLGRPVYVRTHHLFCSGNCHGAPKWGSTNVYREDEKGEPVFDWTFIDLIFDTILSSRCRPFVELGFMPRDLADPTRYDPASGDWTASAYRRDGWACPPKDYGRWHELVRRTVQHCLERYGEPEVLQWYWELWNEPDIPYWRGTREEFEKLYDYTAAAVKSAHPRARVGGPAVTNPGAETSGSEFLSAFLSHASAGTNHCTGGRGAPLDFVTFHAKGGGYSADARRRKENPPSVKSLLETVAAGHQIIDRFPEYRSLECVISECDPDGWAAGGAWDNVNLAFRNTEYYATYVACAFDRILKYGLAKGWKVKVLSWAFLFVGERCFEGTRTFATQGIGKAILNLFQIYARMAERMVMLESGASKDPLAYADPWGNAEGPDVDGVACRGPRRLTVLLHSHHDNWDRDGSTSVSLEAVNLPFSAQHCTVQHFRIDASHSNAHAEWVRQGQPLYPSAAQRKAIKARQGLETVGPARVVALRGGTLRLRFPMPVRAVSLLVITPASRGKES